MQIRLRHIVVKINATLLILAFFRRKLPFLFRNLNICSILSWRILDLITWTNKQGNIYISKITSQAWNVLKSGSLFCQQMDENILSLNGVKSSSLNRFVKGFLVFNQVTDISDYCTQLFFMKWFKRPVMTLMSTFPIALWF